MIKLKCKIEGGRLITVASLNKKIRTGATLTLTEDELANDEVQYLINKGFLVNNGDAESQLIVDRKPEEVTLFCTLPSNRRVTLDSIKATVNGQSAIMIPSKYLNNDDVKYSLSHGILTSDLSQTLAPAEGVKEVNSVTPPVPSEDGGVDEVKIDEVSKSNSKTEPEKFRADSDIKNSFKEVAEEVYSAEEVKEEAKEEIKKEAPPAKTAQADKKNVAKKSHTASKKKSPTKAKGRPVRKKAATKPTTSPVSDLAKDIYSENS